VTEILTILTLETERLRLRAFTLEDADIFERLHSPRAERAFFGTPGINVRFTGAAKDAENPRSRDDYEFMYIDPIEILQNKVTPYLAPCIQHD
jgi:predicted protein tyrosine phosphatase